MKKLYALVDVAETVGRNPEKSLNEIITDSLDNLEWCAESQETIEKALKNGIDYFENYDEDTEELALVEVTIKVLKKATKPDNPWKWTDVQEKKAK